MTLHMKKPLREIPKRKTKIVATLGPASISQEVIAELITAGVNVFRLNFSHGTHEQHSKSLQIVREESSRLGKTVAILQDLCGPKFRIGSFPDGEETLQTGSSIVLKYGTNESCSRETLYISTFNPTEIFAPGERASLSDGKVHLRVTKVTDAGVELQVITGGVVRSRAGITLPDSHFNLAPLTEKDYEDVRWAVESGIDYIALSFVTRPSDIVELKDFIQKLGSDIPVVSKIERKNSLDYIEDIISNSNAVMVARGDLGLELPLERVPSAQRLIIETANHQGIPVITATEMLRSMVTEIRPTRAEVTDVFTAVRDGTDAVMLSEETAIGKYPVEAVRVLDRILREAEKEVLVDSARARRRAGDKASVADAICYAAAGAAEKISASAVLACTQSGYSARLLAKYRPFQTLFGASSEEKTLRRMAVYWGVEPVLLKIAGEALIEDEVTRAMVTVRDNYGLKPGARVVITAGLKAKKSGTTNVMEIREIPRTN